ncbi:MULTISPECIES: DNA-processing protein DprA [unclassified Streptomyces]|uniref:DNA-processing protein DprA n=1 Tax=unclassified Streptomyces TaxID=2593676 RepID=UPI000BACD637|nr:MULTISPECIES: DNA-processing protein DprA [unclassified Streptomyces]ASY32565.1 DNA protecting protein DprA [Streptomyces sp. CLI2509]MYX19819.1 DNA-protecting protein DprA [Streptomyces sp. SID8380]
MSEITRGPAGAGDDERLARAALSRVFEPGEPKTGALLRTSGGASPLLERLRAGEGPPKGFTKARWEGLTARAVRADPQRDLERAATVGARFVSPGDLEWPSQLDDLQDTRPLGLWVRGPADLRMWSLRAVALVGARACTDYGTYLAGALAVGLAERGWVVASGGAFGIDGAAHRGALGVAGGTVAVLACGIDRAYPPGHARLLARIAEQGLLLGELPPGEHPTPSRFVTRNRVIAALTRGTVVVEAALRSGALVTARAAERLGRHVMGVPGPATSGLSAGVHELLRGQAHLVTDAAEIVELVGEIGELAPEKRGPLVPRDLLSPEAASVLAAMPARGVVPAESVALATVTAKDDVIARLYELQALGFVERDGDGWQLTRRTRTTASAGWERGGRV